MLWCSPLFESHGLLYCIFKVEACTVLTRNVVEDKLHRKLKEEDKDRKKEGDAGGESVGGE
jgi:hypothetical protein